MNKIKINLSKSLMEIDAAEEQIIELSKRIEFYIVEYSIELLANKMVQNEFVVPSYQREFTWELSRKSRFIESLIIGLPIPFLFFWEMPDGRLEIVDGSQRLRTIEEFLRDDLKLGDLEGATALSNFSFSELTPSRQRKIKNRSIRGIVLNEHADEQARFDLFDRINTSSKIAKPSEVRRGALSGPFMELVQALTLDDTFTKLSPVSIAGAREREADELITRFFGYGDGLEGYRDRPGEFLFNYVKKMNERFENNKFLRREYEEVFSNTMKFADEVFPNGFKKKANSNVTPRARFEALAIGTRLALDARPNMQSSDVHNIHIWLESDEFKAITSSDGANAIARLRERINYVKYKILGDL